MRRLSIAAAAGIVAALLGLPTVGDQSAASDAPPPAKSASFGLSVDLLSAEGKVIPLRPESPAAARVIVFFSGECPVSRSYVPELNRLAEGWTGSGVEFWAIWADVTTAPKDVRAFAKEYSVRFPILVDRTGEVAKSLGPTHLPEAFVLDAAGQVTYRGRIDDAYADLGRRRPEPTTRDLADAVDDLLQGNPPRTGRTEPVGCLFETAPASSGGAAMVTFTRDVAPILFANCAVCHREGEVGPFPLLTYADAAKRAGQIALVAERRLMPPWRPDQRHGEFVGQRTLTDAQIATLRAWADGGRAEGDPADLPPVPDFPSDWPLGEPDLVLEMPEAFEIPADGPDIFRNFVIPTGVTENKRVAAVDFRPGNPRVVHHSLLFLDGREAARKLDEAAPGPGYGSFGGPGFAPSGAMGGWSPGKTPRRLPDGLGRRLRKNWDLVMQVHYHPSGKSETDRSKVAVYFAEGDGPVAGDVWLGAYDIDIPPGESDYVASAEYVLPAGVTVLGVVPHMHLLGRRVTATATPPDGETRTLVSVPDWSFDWQDDYVFARPVRLPAGTRLSVQATYDNSADNPSNPNSPPARVTWGEGTGDEMLYCFLLVRTDDPKALGPMQNEILIREATKGIFGLPWGR